jgi:hypothetical protein
MPAARGPGVSTPRKRDVRQRGESREGVLGTIRNPLVFFALALLIIEGIIGLVVAQSKMTGDQQFDCVMVMAGLFLAVVGSVVWITIKWPTHLYEGIARVARDVDLLKSVVGSQGFRDAVIDIVEERMSSAHPALPQGGEQTSVEATPHPENSNPKEIDHARE